MGKTQQLGTLVNGLTVDANGNVGIGGAVDASYKLKLTGALNVTSSILSGGTVTVQTTAGTAPKFYLGQTATAAWSITNNASANTLSIIDEQFGNTRLFIGSTGNVGIGTSSPAVNVHISSGADTGIRLASSAGAYSTYIEMYGAGGGGAAIKAIGGVPMIFEVGGSQRMQITSGGNVGIGTSSPAAKLDVAGAGTFSSTVTATQGLFYSGNGTSTQIQLGNGNVFYYNIGRYSADGLLYFYGNQSGYTGYVFGGIDGERMRITSSGNLMINRGSDDGNKVSVNGSLRVEGGSGINVFSGGGTGPFQVDYPGVVGGRLSLDNNGALTIRGALTQNASDIRLKSNIKNIPNALDKICKLNGIYFTWDTDIYNCGRINDIGVIAQEVKQVLPDAVTLAPFDIDVKTGKSLSGNDYLTVYYEKLTALLIEGVKELKAEIEILKNK